MDTRELHEAIAGWETLHVEFKDARVHPDALAAALSSFANTDGGRLIVGVGEDRVVRGVPDLDAFSRLVEDVARQKCVPAITVLQETVRLDEGDVVVIHVPRGEERPYRTDKGVHFVRTAGGRRQASRQELLRLFQATRSLFFDETSVMGATLAALDRTALDEYLQLLDGVVVEPEALLANLNLVRSGVPTVAGLLLFGKAPHQLLPGAYLSAARIAGTELSGEVVDQKTIEGRLGVVFDDAARFLRLHLFTSHEAAGFEPERRPELPEKALREPLLNALAHRDYTVAGPVRLLVFDDRVEIRSPGRLPNAVSVEAIRRGAAHVVRNPTVFATLARMGQVTDIGRGVLRLITLVREKSGGEVTLVEDANEFVVVIPRPAKA